MKNFVKYLGVFFGSILFASNVNASTTNINLESFDGIKEYESYDDFISDYNSDSLPDVYITNFLFDGVDTVKTPDLDDFIENESNDTKIKELEIKVLNINNIGDYELTGETTGTMIAVNTNNLKGNINIILNGVVLDTDSKKAPGIYVYNKDITYTDCIVTIKTKSGTKNYIEGGKLKKVSLVPSDKLSDYTSYYTNEDAKTNYETYTSYYGIYTSDVIDDILFAKVQADSEDLADGDPYYFYKASGAISSDIDLYFEGEGYLSVTSKNKEGIETKGNMTFSGGIGDYVINAQDDCLNTTTTSSSNKNARNDLVIDVNSLVAIVDDEGDEGDAIDSNGILTINGGTIYAFSHSNSQDAGLDSGTGTYINGGTIIATGNMSDEISSDSKQDYIYVSFNESIESGTLLVIKDQDDEIIAAFKTNKNIKTLFYSSEELDYDSFKIYSGGEIDGEESNGLYTKVNSYTNGTTLTYSEIKGMDMNRDMSNQGNMSSFLLKMLIGEVIGLVLVIVCGYFVNKKSHN